jgi:DNA-binding winged helix-turn-helix (wHTH) protein
MTVYAFGPFRLETAERRLVREGEVVPLVGKAFDTLQLLVEGAGRLQSQKSLIDRLWPDTFVEPNNLQQNISLIRRLLGEDSGVTIQTVRGQGYRLVAEVAPVGDDGITRPPISDFPVQRTSFARAPDGS